MAEAESRVGEPGIPAFQSSGEGKMLADSVELAAVRGAERGPGVVTGNGVELTLRSRTRGDHGYRMTLDEEGARRLAEALSRILTPTESGMVEEGLPQQANPEG